jgi:hypothetical protein
VANSGALLKRFKELRARFDRARVDGMNALEREDYKQLGIAIRKEGAIIEEQGRLLESLMSNARDNTSRRRPSVKAKEP